MTQVDPKIVEAKEKAEAALLKLPGVTGVDIGFKEVGGKPTDQIAIRVLVAEKKDVPKAQRVPDDIDGFATDVIQRKFVLHQMTSRMRVEDLHPMVDAGTYTPLKGGISIGPCRAVGGFVFAGTLGCVVTDNASGNHMLLSNFHVMCVDNSHAVGDTMTQPSRVDGGACPGGIVGTLARQSLGGKVDCAVAAISGSRGNVCEIVDIGAVAGQGTASLGMKVRKRGRTTMLTYGEVDSIHLTVTVDYEDGIGNVTLTDQIGIKPDTAHNPKFGDHGDSGSVVVDDSRKVVGLYFAGDDTGYGVANPIAAVLSALNVSLCTGGIKIKDLKDLKIEKIEHKDLAKDHKIEIKEHKNEKSEIKELKIEKNEHKEFKIEKNEHKELKVEIKDGKVEIKEIAKLEHPEKRIDEKGGKELKEGGFEGGPGFPGGPGDPGPIFGGGGGIIGQAAGGGKLTDIIKAKELKPEIKEKEQKAEGKDIKSEKPEGKPESKELKDKHEIKEKAEGKVETKNESKNEAKEHKNEAKDHKPEILEKPDNKLEWKEHKHEKLEIKEHKVEKHETKELKIEKIEHKEISKLEHGEKPGFKEKDGKELKEAGFEGPGPGGPGDPGPIFGQAASGGVSPMKAPKEAKEFKVEKVEQKEFKESGGKETKFEKNEIKELKPEKAEKNEIKEIKHEKIESKEHKNELKDHKHEKPEHKIELKEHKNEKAEIKELHKEVIKELAKEISKLEHGEKQGFKEKDGKELKEGGFEGPGGPGDPIDPGPILGQRIAALEQAVASLSHFIGAEQRPDLTRGALSSEPDLAGQSSALAQQAKAAKDAKDAKDVEKIADR